MTFSPNEPRTESARNFVTYYNASDRWRCYRLNILRLKVFGDASAKLFRVARVLQDERALQVNRTVQTAGEHKVSFEQRSGVSKLLDHFIRLQCFDSSCAPALSCYKSCYNLGTNAAFRKSSF